MIGVLMKTIDIISNNGSVLFVVDKQGEILRTSGDLQDWDGNHPTRFNIAEYVQFYDTLEPTIDVLDIGYWYGDRESEYEPPEPDWRNEVLRKMRGELLSTIEEAAKYIDKLPKSHPHEHQFADSLRLVLTANGRAAGPAKPDNAPLPAVNSYYEVVRSSTLCANPDCSTVLHDGDMALVGPGDVKYCCIWTCINFARSGIFRVRTTKPDTGSASHAGTRQDGLLRPIPENMRSVTGYPG